MSSSEEHRESVRQLVAGEPPTPDDKPALGGRLQRLCRVATRDLDASGVGMSLLSDLGDLMTAAASSPAVEMIEELQFTLGEGPCLTAFFTRLPVLVPDLAAASSMTWPAYGPAAHHHGVRAVFAFPLQLGRARLGAMDVYRREVGPMSQWAVGRARSYADAAMSVMLEAPDGDEIAGMLSDAGGSHFEVHQAQGMVMVQLQASPEQALVRMRAYAFLEGRRLSEVAIDIIERRVVLERDA